MQGDYKMKKRSLKTFQLNKYNPSKDDEGNIVESYSDESYEDKALRVNDMLNMHYYGSLEIKEHDMINYEGVAYKVVSIQKFKRFKAIGIEKI